MNDGVLDEAYQQICAEDHPHRIVIHPGVGYRPNFLWPPSPESIMQSAQEHQVTALFESHDPSRGEAYYFTFHPQQDEEEQHLSRLEPAQLFGTSKQVNKDKALIDRLLGELPKKGARIAELKGVPMGLLMCGENNVLLNKQSENNAVSIRHYPNADIFEGVKCVVNGAHTTMGNWGKLERRFEYLSRDERFMFYLTNRSNNTWKTALRIYFNGQRIADGKVASINSPFATHLITDPHERYRALSVQVPYQQLMHHLS